MCEVGPSAGPAVFLHACAREGVLFGSVIFKALLSECVGALWRLEPLPPFPRTVERSFPRTLELLLLPAPCAPQGGVWGLLHQQLN